MVKKTLHFASTAQWLILVLVVMRQLDFGFVGIGGDGFKYCRDGGDGFKYCGVGEWTVTMFVERGWESVWYVLGMDWGRVKFGGNGAGMGTS